MFCCVPFACVCLLSTGISCKPDFSLTHTHKHTHTHKLITHTSALTIYALLHQFSSTFYFAFRHENGGYFVRIQPAQCFAVSFVVAPSGPYVPRVSRRVTLSGHPQRLFQKPPRLPPTGTQQFVVEAAPERNLHWTYI